MFVADLVSLRFLRHAQSGRDFRWNRRMPWLSAIVSTSSQASTASATIAAAAVAPGSKKSSKARRVTGSSDTADLLALLTDRRLVRVSAKKLVYSHIVGMAAGFLSECCEWSECPRMRADWKPIPDDEPPEGSAESEYELNLGADDMEDEGHALEAFEGIDAFSDEGEDEGGDDDDDDEDGDDSDE